MRTRLIFFLMLFACFGFIQSQAAFDRSSFYTAITGENLQAIEEELAGLDKLRGKEAFKGALLMKKAGLLGESKNKLRFFKEGHQKLETAISADSTNSEYRFLRLLIQENAPKIVNYNKEIKKDALYLRKNYKDLPTVLQKVILDYSRHSKELRPGDLKNAGHG